MSDCSSCAAMREALEFYENVENWHRYHEGKRVYVHSDTPESFAVMDYGKRAKKALASTAGQQIVEENRRKDERIEELEKQKDGAYTERDRLVCALSKLWPSHLAFHDETDLFWEKDWRNIVCIHSPAGQLTWHIHDSELCWFGHLMETEGDWDGHTTEEKYRRLEALSPTKGAGKP